MCDKCKAMGMDDEAINHLKVIAVKANLLNAMGGQEAYDRNGAGDLLLNYLTTNDDAFKAMSIIAEFKMLGMPRDDMGVFIIGVAAGLGLTDIMFRGSSNA